jgi:DNA-binding response OmpR family regulator
MSERILVVEDDPELSIMWNYLLNRYGYIVQSAHNVQHALDAFQQQPAAMVIADYYLPGGYGTDLLKRIQALGSQRPTSVLVTSDPYCKLEAYDDFIDAFILKPVRPKQIMNIIWEYLPPSIAS